MGVKLVSSSAGSVELVAPVTASNYTATMPAKTGTVMLDGPAFSATPTTGQAVSGATWTKVVFGTEAFDTNSNYDTATSRFTPTVAGYYQISGILSQSAGILTLIPAIYKNGTVWLVGSDTRLLSASYGGVNASAVNDLVYLNGSTDYVEIYVYMSAATLLSGATNQTCKFSGFMARGA